MWGAMKRSDETLGGSGTVEGTVTIDSNGAFAPGTLGMPGTRAARQIVYR
jgi:hypothetical protein